MKLAIVRHLPTLEALEKAGHIALHAHTGKVVYWNGRPLRAWYIDDYKSRSFTHRGAKYRIEYQDGSFNPYVFRENEI